MAGALPSQVQLLKGEVGSRLCGSWYIPALLVALASALHAGLFSSLPDCPACNGRASSLSFPTVPIWTVKSAAFFIRRWKETEKEENKGA